MCGIVGIVNLWGNVVELVEIFWLIDLIVYCGLFGEGIWFSVDCSFVFGYCWFVIIDFGDGGY